MMNSIENHSAVTGSMKLSKYGFLQFKFHVKGLIYFISLLIHFVTIA